MGIYIFNKEYLISLLKLLEARHKDLDFGKHVIPCLVSRGDVSAYQFPRVLARYRNAQELLPGEPRAARGQGRSLKLYRWSSPVLTAAG